ncbi:MAG: type II secretion system F family protein [Acidimicrobiia bacterium]|nr:type II secretion system F family protein [Acidimicrobiia bacterium]
MHRLATIAAGASLAVLVAAPAAAQTSRASGGSSALKAIGIIAMAVSIIFLGLLFGGFGLSGIERDLRGRLGSVLPSYEGSTWFKRIPLLGRVATSAEGAAKKRGVFDAINSATQQAGLPLRPGEGIAVAGVGAVLAGTIAGLVGRNILLGVAVASGAVVLALLGIQALASRERGRFEDQLPDTLNLISSSLRAGYSLLQAVEAVSAESQEPTAREFGRALSDIRLGASVHDSMRAVSTRMGNIDFRWAVLAMEIQAEVGGNLADVLGTTSDTMVARSRMRREVRALTAEGRISATVLIGLPFFLLGFLWTTNRKYLDPLFESTGGKVALVVAGVLIGIGIVWIRKVIEIDP